jgi:PAS domain S-box-containing protein
MEPVVTGSGNGILAQVLEELSGDRPVALRGADGWYLILPARIADYPPTRRLSELPLATVPTLPVDLPVADALARMAGQAVPYALVIEDGQARGIVRRPRLLELVTTSERRGSVSVLRRSEELNRRILEAVPSGIVTVAADGCIIDANAEALRVLGLTWEELSQRRVSDFAGETIWEDGSPCSVADYPVSRCLMTGQPQPAATIGVYRPDGQVSWAMYRAVPVLDPGTGAVAGAVATFLDITERKRAEKALRDSEELHRAIAELTSDYAYVCRVDADNTIVMESVTEGFHRITGFTLDELNARGGWVHLVHPEDLPLTAERMAPLLAGRRGMEELRVITKSGETRWIRYSTLPVWGESQGRVVRLIGAVHNITEQKQAEAKLRKYADQLQALSRRLLDAQETERRHIARELHDEVGQNLTALKLSLEMLARSPPGLSSRPVGDPSAERSLTDARALVNKLIAQVRNLSLDLRPGLLDDLGLVAVLVWHFQRFTARTHVRVVFEHAGLEKRLPQPVETAAYRIVQEGLTNVARHAHVAEATVRLWLEDPVLGVQIEDRGVGFAAEGVLARSSSSGLVGMRERAHLLGGQLTVDSTPGLGTRVTAEIPVRNEGEIGNGFDSDAGRRSPDPPPGTEGPPQDRA